jgi:hypothetical protein
MPARARLLVSFLMVPSSPDEPWKKDYYNWEAYGRMSTMETSGFKLEGRVVHTLARPLLVTPCEFWRQ